MSSREELIERLKKHLDNKLEILWICREIEKEVSDAALAPLLSQIISESEEHVKEYQRLISKLQSD